MVSIFGDVGLLIAFTFIGPLPFIPIETTLPLATAATALYGFSYAFVMVSTFTRAQFASIQQGFAEETDNYHFIAGILYSYIKPI